MISRYSFTLLLTVLTTFAGFSTMLHVPGSYSSIQAAIDASSSGDTVLVAAGTYYENINLEARNIVLCSWYLTTGDTAYISNTIIDGNNTGRVITINQGESSACLVSGFTIRNGNSTFESGQIYGGGIFIENSSPRIAYCVIQNNYAPDHGGGIAIEGTLSGAIISNCTIKNNTADSFGGGVFMGDCSQDAEMVNCIISGNLITCSCNFNGGGGGVYLNHKAKLTNCLVINNSAPNALVGGGGVFCDWGDYYGSQGIFVTGCTITNNSALDWGGTSFVINGGEFRNCIIWGNTDNLSNTSNYTGNTFSHSCTTPLPAGTGNTASDPLFVNPSSGNFGLSSGSPCIDAGNNSYNNQPLDLAGNPRTVNTIDMGAFESTSTTVTVQVGSGSDTSGLFPVYTYYGYNYSQQIYLGSEITSGGGTAGSITKIRFYYSGGGTGFTSWNEWTVYLGNTTKSGFLDGNDWVPASSMTEVFSGIIPDPIGGTWVELTLTTPFNYTGGNIVVAIDENSDFWDDPAYWGSFDSGSPRGLLFYDNSINPDPLFPPYASVGPDYSIARIQFEMISNPFAPPAGLEASLSGAILNDVHLTWMTPGSVPDQWIRWGAGNHFGSLGYGSTAATFTVASRWPVADIAPYDGTYLKKIRFIISEVTAAYTVKVWKGTDASTLLHSQVVVNPYINSWNEVTLTTPVLIDGTEELWFGYEVIQTTGYPAGLSPGPAVAGKGDMINTGGGWFSMKNAWNFDYNWTLQGFVSESAMLAPQQVIATGEGTSTQAPITAGLPDSTIPKVVFNDMNPSVNPGSGPKMAGTVTPISPSQVPVLSSGVFTGYNVYRNDVKIGNNIVDLYYDDPALPKGEYLYGVSAQYDIGESQRITKQVNIYTCFPPTGVSVPMNTITTTSAVVSWIPSTISTNLEWTLEWRYAGFPQGFGTIIMISTNPEYTITGLDPGREYDIYLSTHCSGTDESELVMKKFRTRSFVCPAGATPESEVCGTNTNGCDPGPPAYQSITCGDTVCGSSWLARSQRDSDWYSFTLTQTSDVTITGYSDFPGEINIGSAPCPSAIFDTGMYIYPWSSNSITLRYSAGGPYFVKVTPTFAGQVACDSLNRYILSLTCNTCLSPTALNAVNFTPTSAELEWTSGAALWNIEWGPFGFSPGSGTVITGITSNPYNLSGLTMGYPYSFYVQSDCGGGSQSNWSGPYTFTLPCPAISLPYGEDFSSQFTGIQPQCWRVTGDGQPSNWIVEDAGYSGGSAPELAFVNYNPYVNGRSYLVSPVINTSGQTTLDLSFKQYIFSYSFAPTFEVWTTSDGGVTWNEVSSVSQIGANGPETVYLTINNPDVGSADFQFAFAINGYSWDVQNWQIDDILLTGTGPPATTTVQNQTILNGQSTCYDATQTITVAGGGTAFIIEDGGASTMIAGVNIICLPGTWVKPGGYMLGRIAPGGPWCGSLPTPPSFVSGTGEDKKNPPSVAEPGLKLYPNPTTGNFRLELAGSQPAGPVRVEVCGMRGDRVLSEVITGLAAHDFSLADRPAGIYFVKVIGDGRIYTAKVVMTK